MTDQEKAFLAVGEAREKAQRDAHAAQVAKDATGQDLRIGDKITLEMVVTGLHQFESTHPTTGEILNSHRANVARILPDGRQQHFGTYPTETLTKAKAAK